MVLALDKLGVTIELQPAKDWNMERVELDEEDADRLNRMCQQKVPPNAIQVCHQRPQEGYPNARKRICYSLFETDRCPDAWVDDLDHMDQIWVFSEFNRNGWAGTFLRKGLVPDKIKTIPYGIDSTTFSPDVQPVWITNKKGYSFLTVGDFTERKNFEGLIEAFVTEFTAEDDVCLIVKAHFGGFVRRNHDAVMEKLTEIVDRFGGESRPRVLFFGDKVPADEMPKLYRAADCFALASRGEGLGIPMIESLACGIPVISTNWGAQTDYLTAENSLPIEADVRIIDDINYIRKCPVALNHSWAFPRVDDIRKQLRWMFEHQEEGRAMGAQGRKDMLDRTWQKAAIAIIRNVLEMGQ